MNPKQSNIIVVYPIDIQLTAKCFIEYLQGEIANMERSLNSHNTENTEFQTTIIEHTIPIAGYLARINGVVEEIIEKYNSKRIIFFNPSNNQDIIRSCVHCSQKNNNGNRLFILADPNNFEFIENSNIIVFSKYSDLEDLAKKVLWGFKLAIYQEALQYPVTPSTDELASTPVD